MDTLSRVTRKRRLTWQTLMDHIAKQTLTAAEKSVLWAMCRFADWNTGLSYASQITLSAYTGLTRTTVRAAIGRLERRGMLHLKQSPQRRKDGKKTPATYLLAFLLADTRDDRLDTARDLPSAMDRIAQGPWPELPKNHEQNWPGSPQKTLRHSKNDAAPQQNTSPMHAGYIAAGILNGTEKGAEISKKVLASLAVSRMKDEKPE